MSKHCLFLIFLLVGCSGTQYKKNADSFKKGVDSAVPSLQSFYEAYEEQLLIDHVKKIDGIEKINTTTRIKQNTFTYDGQADIKTVKATLDGLKAYANALATLADTDSPSDTGAYLTDIGGYLASLGLDEAEEVSGIFGNLATLIIDVKAGREIRKVVLATHPKINRLGDILKGQISRVSNGLRSNYTTNEIRLRQQIERNAAMFESQKQAAGLNAESSFWGSPEAVRLILELREVVKKKDGLTKLETKLQKAVTTMVDAHQKLDLKAHKNKDVVIATLRTFLQAASDLKDDVDAWKKASDELEE